MRPAAIVPAGASLESVQKTNPSSKARRVTKNLSGNKVQYYLVVFFTGTPLGRFGGRVIRKKRPAWSAGKVYEMDSNYSKAAGFPNTINRPNTNLTTPSALSARLG